LLARPRAGPQRRTDRDGSDAAPAAPARGPAASAGAVRGVGGRLLGLEWTDLCLGRRRVAAAAAARVYLAAVPLARRGGAGARGSGRVGRAVALQRCFGVPACPLPCSGGSDRAIGGAKEPHALSISPGSVVRPSICLAECFPHRARPGRAATAAAA